MSKAGRTMLLVAAIFAIAGATQNTFAKTHEPTRGLIPTLLNSKPEVKTVSVISQASTCSSVPVSTPFCNELISQSCKEKYEPEQLVKQVQGAAVLGSSSEQKTETINTKPETLPTMAPLNSQIAPDNAALDVEKIFNLVNQYRQSRGLSPFEKDERVCELAQTRSNEIIGEISNGVLHSGLYNRNLPYWIWENAKYGSNEEGTVAWWLASPVHHQSIVGDYKFSCVKCSGSYCAQLFTSFVPKQAPQPTEQPQSQPQPEPQILDSGVAVNIPPGL